MISRLTSNATLAALLAAASLAAAASARDGFADRVDTATARTAVTPTRTVRIVELPRVVVVGRRTAAH